MSSYRTPVLTTCDSDPTAYYSWQEKPERSVLLHDQTPPAEAAKVPKKEVRQHTGGAVAKFGLKRHTRFLRL